MERSLGSVRRQGFTKSGVLNEEFPNITALICAFHAMKAVKLGNFKDKIVVQEKPELRTLFKKTLYPWGQEDYERKETAVLLECFELLADYYNRNWKNSANSWVLAIR